MKQELIKLGQALKKIDPELSGEPEVLARTFIAKNPEYADLISEQVRDLITADVEEDYLWPFHSAQKKAADRQANIAANEAHLKHLSNLYDFQQARQLGIPVSVLPQVMESAVNYMFQMALEAQKHRHKLEEQRDSHALSTQTMDQTIRLTKELQTATLETEIRKFWDEIKRKEYWSKYILELRELEAMLEKKLRELRG